MRNYIYFYDTPHLLKSVRNNLIKYDFLMNGHPVKWQYIKDFYNRDSQMSLRLAPKLSSKHIYCNTFEKMRVCLAAQVFSRSVAAGIHTCRVRCLATGSLPYCSVC